MTTENDRAVAAKIVLGTAYEKTIEVESHLVPTMCGSITFSLPSGKDLARIAILQHDLREGRPLDDLDVLSGGLMVALSTLSVIVRTAPDWWYRVEGEGKTAKRIAAPELLIDQELIWGIWGEYVAFRDTFPRRSDTDASRTATSGTVTAPFSEEAQPASV